MEYAGKILQRLQNLLLVNGEGHVMFTSGSRVETRSRSQQAAAVPFSRTSTSGRVSCPRYDLWGQQHDLQHDDTGLVETVRSRVLTRDFNSSVRRDADIAAQSAAEGQ